MKHLIFAILMGTSLQASAWISQDPTEKVYSFKFTLKGSIYKYEQKAPSYEDAFEKAAKACYRHFKAGQRLTEDQGLDIIDVCANPRTT